MGLNEISKEINGIGPHKSTVLSTSPSSIYPSALYGETLVQICRSIGLVVHPYTFRNSYEDVSLARFNGDVIEEYLYLLDLGVDGFFTENTEMARCAIHEHHSRSSSPNKRELPSSQQFAVQNFGELPPEILYFSVLGTGALGLVVGIFIGAIVMRRPRASATTKTRFV